MDAPPTSGFTHFLRYTYPDEPRLNEFIAWVTNSNVRPHMIAYEVGSVTEKRHIHVLVKVEVAHKTFEKALTLFRKNTGQKGNEFISSKIVTDEAGVKRYMCKGENVNTLPSIVAYPPFPPSVINTWHRQYYETGGSRKRKGGDLTIMEVRDQCLKRLKTGAPLGDVIRVVVDECKGRYMHRQQYVSMVNAVHSLHNPSEWSSNMVMAVHRVINESL